MPAPISLPETSPLRLQIRGVGNLIGFKNRKRIAGKNRDKLITEPRVKKQMEAVTKSFASQLLSASRTGIAEISMDALRSFLTASVPRDDNWTIISEVQIRGELVPLGEEGADIIIEHIST